MRIQITEAFLDMTFNSGSEDIEVNGDFYLLEHLKAAADALQKIIDTVEADDTVAAPLSITKYGPPLTTKTYTLQTEERSIDDIPF